MIESAAAEAKRLDAPDPSLPRALLAIANAIAVIDLTRVWDLTFEAVKAVNSAEGFTGEDGILLNKFQSKGSAMISSKSVEEFNVEGIFRQLALLDYDRSVELLAAFEVRARGL